MGVGSAEHRRRQQGHRGVGKEFLAELTYTGKVLGVSPSKRISDLCRGGVSRGPGRLSMGAHRGCSEHEWVGGRQRGP